MALIRSRGISQRRAQNRFIVMIYLLMISLQAQDVPKPLESLKPPAAEAEPLPFPARLQAYPFALRDVRLLSGIFQSNQELCHQYLLSLDTEVLLHDFRTTAQLLPASSPSLETESISQGAFLGHYLSALAAMYASTGDEALRDRIRNLVVEVQKCQTAQGTGYVGPSPDSDPHWEVAYQPLMAGLLAVYQETENVQALDVVKKMARFLDDRRAKLKPKEKAADAYYYSGMAEVLFDLFAVTENPQDLHLAQAFLDQKLNQSLAAQKDELAGLPTRPTLKNVLGLARNYELTQDETSQKSVLFFWNVVTQRHSFATGGMGFSGKFGPPGQETKGLGTQTAAVDDDALMLRLTEHLFHGQTEASIMDVYERILYNQILAAIEPKNGMMSYNLPLVSGHFKTYQDLHLPGVDLKSGWEIPARFGQAIYAHFQDTLWVNLLIPSEVNWKKKGVTLHQETSFPQSNTTRLTLTFAQPTELILMIRVPGWASQGVTLKINGVLQNGISALPASYLKLERSWTSGDVIEVTFPMNFRVVLAQDNGHRVSLFYGPLLLAAALGTEDLPPNDQLVARPEEFGDAPNLAVPDLLTTKMNASWILTDPVVPLRFQTQGVGVPFDFSLMPFYQLHHQRYAVYFRLAATAAILAKERKRDEPAPGKPPLPQR